MKTTTNDLFRETKDKFVHYFGDCNNCYYIQTPASLVFLGDHTHYNEGVLLSTAVNKYVTVAGRRRKDRKILLVSNFAESVIDLDFPDTFNLGNRFPEKFIFSLFSKLKEKELLNCGLEIAFTSEIPDCLGLGSVAAHQIALLKIINKIAGLKLNNQAIVDLSREIEQTIVGKISNEAHHWTALNSRLGNLVFTDLRTRVVTNILFDYDELDIVVFDTDVEIPDAPKICSERINECEIGASTLKMYMWGIRNLRDISEEFLQKKVFALPKKLYQRISYNVHERLRVEEALRNIFNSDLSDFGKMIFLSHKSISSDYSLSNGEVDFLVEKSSYIKGVIAAKMISCTPKRSLFSLVNRNYSEEFVSELQKKYLDKYGKNLIVYKMNISSGAKLFRHLDEVLV